MEAVAINKDGNYSKLSIENSTNNISPTQPYLYKGHDYDYYGRLYSGALTKRNIGIGLTFFGVSLVGAIKATNNKNAMEMTKKSVYLSLSTTK